MPYDAFGNQIDEDRLPGLVADPTGVPGGRPPRRGVGVIAVVVLTLLVVGAAVAIVAATGGGGDLAVTQSVQTTPAPNTSADPAPERKAAADPEPAAPAKPAQPAKPPTGLQTGSLLRPANLEVALRRLRKEAKGRPRNVRVDAERVNIQLILGDGRMRNAMATWDGDVRVLSTTQTPIGGLEAFSWSRIDTDAPRRLVRSATGRARKPASAFNYAVLLDVAGLQWSAFLRNGAGFAASPTGRIERQISG